MKKRGQSMIEYALIAVLVILGVVIMGPYVLRSVNAHFKLWDEGVQDSFTENITQAPVSDVPDISINCVCPVSKGNCGSSDAGSRCGENQREWDYNCTPQGCNGAAGDSYCLDDLNCCTGWVDLCKTPPCCGTVPCPGTGCSGAPTSPPPAPRNCYFGQKIQGQQCGSDTSIRCAPESPKCDPGCQGIIIPGNLPCPNNPPFNGTHLLQNYDITYVQGVDHCDGTTKCQYYSPCVNQGCGCGKPPPDCNKVCGGDALSCSGVPDNCCVGYTDAYGAYHAPVSCGTDSYGDSICLYS